MHSIQEVFNSYNQFHTSIIFLLELIEVLGFGLSFVKMYLIAEYVTAHTPLEIKTTYYCVLWTCVGHQG